MIEFEHVSVLYGRAALQVKEALVRPARCLRACTATPLKGVLVGPARCLRARTAMPLKGVLA